MRISERISRSRSKKEFVQLTLTATITVTDRVKGHHLPMSPSPPQ